MELVSRETESILRQYCALLLKWQEKINLISPTTTKDAWARHFKDSLQLLPYLPESGHLYDLGAGAGFPGLVLAIVRPELEITLVEADSKKCAFLQTVSRETGARVHILNARIEAAVQSEPPPDILTARALAGLSELLNYATPWIAANPALTALFPKGVSYRTELDAAKAAGWVFDLDDWPSKTDPAARILRLQNIRKTN